MRFEAGYIFGMILQTIPEPRKVARDLFDLPVTRRTRWIFLALVIVGAAILGVISHMVYPVEASQFGPILSNPMTLSMIEAGFMVAAVWAIYAIGRLMGGVGTLDDAISIAVWLEFVLVCLQTLILIFSLIAPALAGMFMVMSSVLFFWILTHFTTESHQFKSAGIVFVSIMAFMLLCIFALSFVFVLMGVEPVQLGT